MPLIVTSPRSAEPTVRAIMADLLKFGYRFEYLQNYPICGQFTTRELRAMWDDVRRKMERL